MSFSTVFKELRRKCELTQEDVASALSVTPQAVSRWECGTAMPDITLIPKISHMFGVTSDYLLEIDINRTEEEVNQIIESAGTPYNFGKLEEVVRIYRNGLSRFPNNHRLMHHLAFAIHGLSSKEADAEKRKALLSECCSLCEKILSGSTDNEIRTSAVQTYVYALSDMARNGFDPTARRKAEELAESMPSKYVCREELLMGIADFEEAYEILRKKVFNFFYHDLPFFILWTNKSDTYTDEETLAICETAEKLYDIAFADDELYSRSWSSSFIWETASELYLKKGDTENALRYIRRLADEAIRWDSYRHADDENAGTFTVKSLLFRGITEKKGRVMTNGGPTKSGDLYKSLTGESYAALRGNGEFERILKTLSENAKLYQE